MTYALNNVDSQPGRDREGRGGYQSIQECRSNHCGQGLGFRARFILQRGDRTMEGSMILPEIRLIQAAIALAEELHFSRAALRLYVDQSTLSRRIQELEGQLGFRLFKRDHQTVELTDAGRSFLEEGRIALHHVERAVQSGRQAKEYVHTVLNVGRSPYTDPFLVTALQSIKLPLFP